MLSIFGGHRRRHVFYDAVHILPIDVCNGLTYDETLDNYISHKTKVVLVVCPVLEFSKRTAAEFVFGQVMIHDLFVHLADENPVGIFVCKYKKLSLLNETQGATTAVFETNFFGMEPMNEVTKGGGFNIIESQTSGFSVYNRIFKEQGVLGDELLGDGEGDTIGTDASMDDDE